MHALKISYALFVATNYISHNQHSSNFQRSKLMLAKAILKRVKAVEIDQLLL